MTCTHSAVCPLFQLLDTGFDGWRHHYCDSAGNWRECARYQQSIRGQHVPLSLLPNGHDAVHLAQRARSGAHVAAPVGATTGTPTLADLMFERPGAPARAARTAGPSFTREQLPRPRPRPLPERQQAAPPPGAPAHRTRPGEHWWNRLADWMRRPM
jgi:hypothetical protein